MSSVAADEKYDLMNINNNWNDKNERLIVSIGENAAGYKWMHEKSSSFYSYIHKGCSLLLIFLNTALSTETIISSDNNNLDILKRIFLYSATVLSLMQNFIKYEQLAMKHTLQSNEFSKLYHDVQLQMSMYRKNRVDANIYVSELITKLDSLVVAGPDIASYALRKFKKTFNNDDIALPNIADKIQRIEIIDETGHVHINTEENPKKLTRIAEISNIFAIQGDINDEEIEMKKIERKAKIEYETQRYNQYYQE
jgi:hypothetical protein